MLELFVLLTALVSALPAAAPDTGDAAVPQAATVRGTITLKPEPARRVANRYAGASAQASLQSMPAVVFLRGAGLSAAGAAPTAAEMSQRDTAFAPSMLVVTKGSTVGFRNRDPFYHNVFSYSKTKRFDLGRYPAPESKPVRFDQTGTVEIFCEIHRSMRAVVLVTDNRFHTQVAEDGSYALTDVPPGEYELVAWHADRGQKVVKVTVPAAGVVTVNTSL